MTPGNAESRVGPVTADGTEPGTRIGSLFSGYGGLEEGVRSVVGGTVAWHSENDPAASKVLARQYPDVPNLGDITKVDWLAVEPVDVLTGGSPCQDVSHAGKRVGMKAGTRSSLWASMCDAIDVLRPGLVVWENVRGVLSAEADSALEPCAGCVGDGDDGAVLRALGRVLGDLAGIGYDCRWYGLRAADVGAPHGRFRVFVIAHPAGDSRWLEYGDSGGAAHADGSVGEARRRRPRGGDAGRLQPLVSGGSLLPTPTGRDGKGPNQRGDTSYLTGALMPTPRATDGTKGGPNQRGSSGDLMLPSLVTLLPTPSVSDGNGGHLTRSGDRSDELLLPGVAKAMGERLLPTPPNRSDRDNAKAGTTLHDVSRDDQWGTYAAAVARWEHLTRAAPAPTQPNRKGTPQLAPRFSEWMMGLPDGWVTDVPGLSRNDMLRILGNGVVPQQAALAVRTLLHLSGAAA